MVVCVGCDFNIKKLSIYDSAAKEEEKVISLDFDKEHSGKKTNKIDLLFKCLKAYHDDKPIDCLAVVIDDKSDNTFRKKFIQAASNQNVKVVRFLEWKHLLLCCAIERLSISSPEPYDMLFIFLNTPKGILLMKASFDENNGWEFYGSSDQERNGNDLEDFTKLKETLPKIYGKPYVCVFSKDQINETIFKTVFSENKRIEFEYDFNPTWSALNYARYVSNEDGFDGYKISMILSREILLRHTSQISKFDKTYCKIPADVKLPFTLTFQDDDAAWYIYAYEDGEDYCRNEFSVKTPGKNNIILSIDVNGIYTVETKKMFEWKKFSMSESIQIPPKCHNYRSDIGMIGIDLGTTKFCVSVIEKNGPMLAPLVDLDAFGEDEKPPIALTLLPSKVMIDENGEEKIALDKTDGNIFHDSKLIIGKSFDEIEIDPFWAFEISNFKDEVKLEFPALPKSKAKTPNEISTIILKHIKRSMENYHSAVITIPTTFDELKMKAVAETANLADWDIIHFIPEPIAAAFAYFSTMIIPKNCNIIIVNFGGGILDICVANVLKNQMKILSFDAFENLGGKIFDKVLYDHFVDVLKEEFNIEKGVNMQILIQKCQEIKHTLSNESEAWLYLRDLNIKSDKKIKITRKEFEELSKEILLKLENSILCVFKNSQLQKTQLHYVFHVGGGCYMPMIKELLLEIFPNAKHQCDDHSDEIVAKGAALYAYYLKTRNNLPTWKRWIINTLLLIQDSKPRYR